MEKTVQIYYTSDTHGHIFPVNYAANCPEKTGLLNLADQMEKDGNTLVLDGGDSLQGTPLTQYYLENRDRWPVHPVAVAFNAMGLDYFTLGNHDFNFGYEVLRDYLRAMDGVCLCANVEDLGGELPICPWTVHTLANGCERMGTAPELGATSGHRYLSSCPDGLFRPSGPVRRSGVYLPRRF